MRLITFLGTGTYHPIRYCWKDAQETAVARSTPYVAVALAELFGATTIQVLATDKAWQTHGAGLERALREAGLPEPEHKPIELGADRSELWRQFEVMKDLLRGGPSEFLMLDITHGFRHQPFFASAVLTFLRAVDHESPETRVVYGGYELRDDTGVAPLLDITPSLDLVDLSLHLQQFLETGRADGIASTAGRVGRELNREWARSREGEGPRLMALGKCLQVFGQDLETLRTGQMILGSQPKHTRRVGSASSLVREISQSRPWVREHLPPLDDVLDRVQAMVEPLALPLECEGLSEPDAATALSHLARLYFELGRFAEAAATVREGWVTRYAPPEATRPGLPGFSADARDVAEDACAGAMGDRWKFICEIRNDLLHAGHCLQPLSGQSLREQVLTLVSDFEFETQVGCDSPWSDPISGQRSALGPLRGARD